MQRLYWSNGLVLHSKPTRSCAVLVTCGRTSTKARTQAERASKQDFTTTTTTTSTTHILPPPPRTAHHAPPPPPPVQLSCSSSSSSSHPTPHSPSTAIRRCTAPPTPTRLSVHWPWHCPHHTPLSKFDKANFINTRLAGTKQPCRTLSIP